MQSSTIPAWGKSKAPPEPFLDATTIKPKRVPKFTTADGAASWLKSLPLTNLGLAYDATLGQLKALAATEIPPLERARIAEVMREQVAYLHIDLARRYAGKAQPMPEREAEMAAQAVALWQALWEQYSACLKPLLDGDTDLAAVKSKLLQRGLYVGKELVVVHALARKVPPPALWQELHAYYRLAEVLDCTGTAVSDPLMPRGVGISCYSTYAHALLLGLADPCAMSVRQIELTDRWLERWSRKIFPHAKPREGEGPLMLIDLSSSAGITLPTAKPVHTSEWLRYAYAGKLGTSVHGRLKRLRAGADPVDLQLGQDCTVEQCMTLLSYLESRWCWPQRQASAREPASHKLFAGGLYGAFFRAGGRCFEREDPTRPLSFRGTQHLASFEELTDYDRGKDHAEREWRWERWQGCAAADEATLTRHDAAHYRVNLDQLVILGDGESERAGFVTRVACCDDGMMEITLRLWPGKPRALTLRPLSTALSEQHPPVPALMLSASGDDKASFIVPCRTFHAGRELRCTDGGERRYALVKLLQRGADFERIAIDEAK